MKEEKNSLQKLISTELSEKKWGYRGRIKLATNESNARQDNISQQISDLRTKISSLASKLTEKLNSYDISFNNNLKTIDQEYLTLEKNITVEIEKLNNVLEERVLMDTESVKEELETLEEEIRKINEQYNSEIDKININTKEVGSLFDAEIDKISINTKEIGSLFDAEISSLNENNNKINQEFEENKVIIEEERDSKINSLENQNIKIEELQNNKNEIKNINLELKDDFNVQVFGSIIHNFALKVPMWLYSSCGNLNDEGVLVPAESAADISSDCLDFTSTIWFGAMSLVVATTGTAVALGSEVLRTSHPIKKRSNTGINILRILKFVRRPRIKKVVEIKTVKQIDTVVKEVIKEVPVEKVVPTEVLKEKLVKQVVHIPVYTNDPALLNQSHNEKTDKDKKKK